MFLRDQITQPFPVGLVAAALLRKMSCLRDICFSDAEYGDQARAAAQLQDQVTGPLNKELMRSGKPLRFLSVMPNSTKHHRLSVVFQRRGSPAPESVDFLLFPPSARALARENDPEAEMSGPRRGGRPPKVPKAKKPKKPRWE